MTTQRTVMAMIIYIGKEDEAEGASEVGEAVVIVSKRREEGRERERRIQLLLLLYLKQSSHLQDSVCANKVLEAEET